MNRDRPGDPDDRRFVVEVPLVGDGPSTSRPGPDPADRRLPATRRNAALVAVGALLGGTALAIVLLPDDEPPPGDVAAELSPDELSSRITTPPTLPPVTELPTPDDPALRSELPTTSLAPLTPPPPTPTYPAAIDGAPSAFDDVAIAAAVARLDEDVARRSTTHVELGTAGFVLDVTIVRDPERDRYHVTLESRGRTEVAIVDGATDTTYINPGTDNRFDVSNAELIAGSSASSVNEYFDRLLLGPLRPGTIDAAAVQDGDLVRIDGIGPAQRFAVGIPGSAIPEWQIYDFSPVFEFRVEDRPSRLEYSAYVDASGELRQVDGTTFIGNVPQLVQHRIERLDPPEPVDLAIGTGSTVPEPTTTPSESTIPVTSDGDDGDEGLGGGDDGDEGLGGGDGLDG